MRSLNRYVIFRADFDRSAHQVTRNEQHRPERHQPAHDPRLNRDAAIARQVSAPALSVVDLKYVQQPQF
jgi:hypothetical protein